MKKPPRLTKTLVGGVMFSVGAGIVSSSIKWGDPEGFHGKGVPFAIVYWDRDRDTGQFRDYNFYLAPLLNVVAFIVVVSVFLTLIWMIWKWTAKTKLP